MRSTRFCIMLPAALLLLGGPQGISEAPQTIDVVASKFSYSPSEIKLKKGQTVTLVFHSSDVTHGVKLPELNIDCAIQKGKKTEVTVTPSETGQFFGKCAYFCGKGHGSMILQINVVE